MNHTQPIYDPTTHYRMELWGRVDVDWLQSFDSSAEILVEEAGQIEEITVLDVHTDQAGIVGLLRSLHGLGITILKFQIITRKDKT